MFNRTTSGKENVVELAEDIACEYEDAKGNPHFLDNPQRTDYKLADYKAAIRILEGEGTDRDFRRLEKMLNA